MGKKMVILHLAYIINSPYSGVSVVVPEYLREQSKYANVALVNVKKEKIAKIPVQFDYTDTFSISRLPAPFNKPDLVIFQECYRKQYLRVASELRACDIPYIIVPHGELREEAQHEKRIKKVLANVLLFDRFINHSRAIQCLSRDEMTHTRRKNKICLSNGIRMPSESKRWSENNEILFIYIGRLDIEVKGLDLLIKAVSKNREFLKQNHCSFRIYGPDIKGRGEQLSRLIEMENVSDIVQWHSGISGDEKEKALLDGDIFVLTSRHEGMPMAILEASSYGIPSFVTYGTSMGEWIKENDCGWVCECTIDSICEQMLIAVKEKQKYIVKGNNARIAVKRDYLWDNITKLSLETYNRLIENRHK